MIHELSAVGDKIFLFRCTCDCSIKYYIRYNLFIALYKILNNLYLYLGL